jgi:hypothetical protein
MPGTLKPQVLCSKTNLICPKVVRAGRICWNATKSEQKLKVNHRLRRGILRLSCGMNWQQFVSLSIVATTAALLLWTKFRRRKFSFARDTHCGCATASVHSPPQYSVVYHARKGGRPEIIVKMK